MGNSGPLQPGGDPFAAAYARQNGVSAAAQAAKLTAARDAAETARDRFAGYGFAGPGPTCPPDPDDAIGECIRAARQILAETIQLGELVPWTTEPYRARTVNDHVQAVLTTTAAFNAANHAAGLALQAANTTAGFTPLLLQMGSATDSQPLFTFKPSQTNMERIKSWGLSAGAAGPKVVLAKVLGTTVGGPPSPPNQFMSSYPIPQQEPVFAVLQPEMELVVTVTLTDFTSPVLLDFGFCAYLWPVNKRKDNREGAILRSGYSLECS